MSPPLVDSGILGREAEIDDIAVSHDVFLALEPDLSVIAARCHRAACDEGVVADDLSANEAACDVAVDFAGGRLSGCTARDRPGAAFILADSAKGDVPSRSYLARITRSRPDSRRPRSARNVRASPSSSREISSSIFAHTATAAVAARDRKPLSPERAAACSIRVAPSPPASSFSSRLTTIRSGLADRN